MILPWGKGSSNILIPLILQTPQKGAPNEEIHRDPCIQHHSAIPNQGFRSYLVRGRDWFECSWPSLNKIMLVPYPGEILCISRGMYVWGIWTLETCLKRDETISKCKAFQGRIGRPKAVQYLYLEKTKLHVWGFLICSSFLPNAFLQIWSV